MFHQLLSQYITKRKLSYFDFWLVGAVCILCVFGIICIGSATHINLGESASTFYSQIIWFIMGLFIMVFVAFFVNYEAVSRFCIPIYIINIALLVAVLLFGHEVNNATRWLRFGPISIQPSEFAKLIMVFCLAKYIDKKRELINNISVLFSICVITFLPVYLIQRQPSLSVSLVIVAIMLIMLFVAGLSYKIIISVAAGATAAIGIVVWDILNEPHIFVDKILYNHHITRIQTFFYPDTSSDTYYQTLKSINAIGSGQVSGKGLYNGTLNQLSYLPEPHNDFIFSVIGEEFGFIGCTLVLALLLFIIFRCVLIAMDTDDDFSRLIVIGIAGMFAFQTFVNTGVATGILPNTGMSLPFVSYGGSSMWTNMAAVGLVMNISMKRSKSLFEGV
ncbi:MAG: rod shape-determining protein RodA [Lachnospiraceae bacterium]|nr:rod shape-determining protein RodA [Lachnospiraceae bacterium]